MPHLKGKQIYRISQHHRFTILKSHSQQVILVSLEDRYEAQHQAMLIIQTLIEFDDQWLAPENEIVNALKQIWETDLYKSCEANVSCDLWHLVAKILLHFFSHHTNDINLLFLLLKALCMRFIPDFQVSVSVFIRKLTELLA